MDLASHSQTVFSYDDEESGPQLISNGFGQAQQRPRRSNSSSASTSSHTESLLGRQSPILPLHNHQQRDDNAVRHAQDDEKAYADDSYEEPTTDEVYEMRERGRRNGPPAFVIPDAEALRTYTRKPRQTHGKLVAGGLVALFFFAYGATQLLSLGTRFGRTGPRVQVILMISDGMGPATETLAREYLQYLHSNVDSEGNALINSTVWSMLDAGFRTTPIQPGLKPKSFGMTPLDPLLVGNSRTRSTSSLVTDSAAGATAFSCVMKTYNGGIAVDPVDRLPCGTILEAAKKRGFKTGLVATSRITHATPAAFYAHVVDRDMESEIATFLVGDGPLGNVVDFAFGGGECFFLPSSQEGSCRTDDQDLIAKATEHDMRVLRGLDELNAWHDEDHKDDKPVIGLFASGHMDFEVDRERIEGIKDAQPSLKQMTVHALKHLQNDNSKGFFLMIEGSRIDMAEHSNDPIGTLSDSLAYLETVQYVKQWVDDANLAGTPTVLISVSDHETGGLSLGRQLTTKYPEYAWYPDAILNATHSTEYLGHLVHEASDVSREWVTSTVFESGLGIMDASTSEVTEVIDNKGNAYRVNRLLADAISRRAQIGWSTAGHSGVDVPLYAYGYNSTALVGGHENTDIGDFIANTMGLHPEVVTIELKKNWEDWHSVDAGDKQLDHTTHVDHYHGEF